MDRFNAFVFKLAFVVHLLLTMYACLCFVVFSKLHITLCYLCRPATLLKN